MKLKTPVRAAAEETATIHHKLVEQIRAQITSGELKPGDKLLSYAAARVQYGVYSNTLEKAHDRLEQEGLIVRRRGLGTFVAAPKSPVVREKRGIIGVIGTGFVFAPISSYWMELLQGIQETADASQAQILLLNYNSLDGIENADGVIACDWSSSQLMPRIPADMPRVLLLSPSKDYSSIEADDYAATREMTKHLLSLGHRKIGYLHSLKVGINVQRFAGYRAALETAGIEPSITWEHQIGMLPGSATASINMGYEAMQEWLREDWRQTGCTALMAHNDDVACGAIRALEEAGLHVPDDVSVAGFDDSEIGNFFRPRLTTVRWPLREVGARAARMLVERIGGRSGETEREILRGELLIRESTAPPPAK